MHYDLESAVCSAKVSRLQKISYDFVSAIAHICRHKQRCHQLPVRFEESLQTCTMCLQMVCLETLASYPSGFLMHIHVFELQADLARRLRQTGFEEVSVPHVLSLWFTYLHIVSDCKLI